MLNVLILLIALSLVLTLIRFLKGPTLADRVIAFDSMSVIATSLLVVLSFYFNKSLYLDLAFVFGLMGFIGTVVFAKFLDKEL